MLELEHGFRIIDIHARLHSMNHSSSKRRYVLSPDQLEREMQQAGIIRTVVFPGSREGGYLRANNSVARHSVDRPFVAFARINGPRSAPSSPVTHVTNRVRSRDDNHVSPTDIERYAYDDRFQGFKLNPVVDGIPDEDVLDRLEKVGLPIIVHTGVGFPPQVLERMILSRSFPVIVAHFGGYPLQSEYMNETIELLSSYDDCYVDTSVVRFREILEQAMREHPDRVIFGSGSPDVHQNVGVMELLALDVPEDTMRKAFSKNAERVLPDILG